MAANLLACASQKSAGEPYRFSGTGIQVYSFEEMLYHCCYKWRQSVDDIFSEDLADWVQNALGLSAVAAQMRALAHLDSLVDRLPALLSLTDYIAPKQLDALQIELQAWEKRVEWERLKDRADDLFKHGEAARAGLLYQQALMLTTNVTLLNNLGIALMAQGQYAQAADCLARAVALEPENVMLLLHLTEAYILHGEQAKANESLAQAEALEGAETADIVYFKGEMQFYAVNYARAAAYYEQASAMQYDPQYIYRLSDAYVKLRQCDKALDVLQAIRDKDKHFLMAQAEIHAQVNNVPAAAKCIERALAVNPGGVELWICLARYHRLNYDLVQAAAAAENALNLAPENPQALLEHARIQKAQGRMRDYQTTMHAVLQGFKAAYRERAGAEVLA